MSRAFLFVLLVSVLEIQAYAPKTITNFTGSGANDTVTVNPVNSEQLVEIDSESTGRQDDQDPVESSETIVYNRFQNFPEDDDELSDSEEDPVDSEGPSEDVIPHSEHKEPRNVPTKPKYTAPGEWAKLAKVRNVSQEDVPLKLLAQVRRTHTVRRLPQREAIENAESDEEKENAARLREVVRNSKVNTVYTEEGYEDSAYDHAGHIKDADFHEGYARKLHDQIDLKKSEDDADKHGEEDSDRLRNQKKTELEEFKDYDEDYREYYEPTTDLKRLVTSNIEDDDEWKDPKVVVEKGVETFKMDVEKEAEKMEKAQENLSSAEKNNSYYQKKERKIIGKQQKKPISSIEYTVDDEENSEKALEEWQVGRNDNDYVENYSTMRVPVIQNGITERVLYETTTSPEVFENSSKNPSVLYGYVVDGNSSPHIESIDFQPVENPSTINYSQLYWDYFKARLNQLTTMPPLPSESTTSSPHLPTGASYIEYGFSPIYREQTSPYPIIESPILNPQKLVAAPSLTNSKYLQTGQNNYIKSKDEIWQPIITTEPPTTVRNQLLEIPNNDQTISLSDSIRNLASQESTKSFDNPLLNPVLPTLMGRKPRYKITIRQKPKKPTESLNSPKQESSSPINDTPSENPVTVNDSYMKVLMHLRNEDNAKNLYSGVSQSSFLSSVHEPKDLTRMRPPAPQKPAEVGYQNFLPPKLVENESARSQSHGRTNHRPSPAHGNSHPGVKQTQSGRKRSSMPAVDLLPPLASSESEYVKYKEANDYLTDKGNWLKQSINVARPFHQASIGIDAIGRVKRRERRNVGGREGSDESRGVVKVAEPSRNNTTPDRGEIDQSIKNRRMKRNSLRAAVDVEVGTAIDKLSVQKNSRSSAIDRRKGFLQSRWKSIAEEGKRSRGLGLKDSLRKSDSQGSSDGTTEVREKSVKKRSVYHGQKHEELLDQSPKITGDIINKEIETRFNGDQEREDEKKKVLVEFPEFDYAQELPEEYTSENVTSPEPTLNSKKYPFYRDERLPNPSALRYAMDPGRIPRKTYGGMEFYNSRDVYKHCAEVEPKLNVLPEKEQPVTERGFNENIPRIRGLGDKLDCYKAKYFDEDPFDNPLFLEKEVEDPTPLPDFDTKQFASRIMLFPKKDDDHVAQKSSKRPESYSTQRKPDSTKASSTMVQKPRRIRYKTYQKTVRPSRPRIYRIRSSKSRYVKARRPQKVIRRPIGSASELSSFYMPYQNQVYEDVMGTIKNMANSYQVHESTTSSPDETGVTDRGILSSKEDKTNATVGATNREEKRNDTVLLNIVEHPHKNVDSNIQGLKPPKYLNRHQTIYKRNRATQNGRIRVQTGQIPLTNHRAVSYRKKIRIYKRDASDEEDEPSIEITSLEENRSMEMVTESFEDVANSTTESTSILYQESTTVAPVVKSAVSKKKTKVPKTITANSEKDPKNETPKNVIYTIRDRIRYSRPKGEVMKIGKFVNETKVEENTRRKEPKYNYIRRRKPSPSASTGPGVFLSNSTDETDWRKLVIVPKTTNESLEVSNEELAKENREIQYIVNNTEIEQLNSSKEPANHSKTASLELSESQTSNKTGNNYAVHENVNETNVQGSPEITRLKTFLDSDSSGYSGISSEDLKTLYVPQSNNSKDFIANLESIESNQKQDDDNASENNHKGYSSDEESSEKVQTNGKNQSSPEFSEEANTSSKGSDSEEDKTFFTYASRPTSPAENYEDEKYSDLGPRVSKPEFFHPRFSFSSYRRFEPKTSSEEYSKETEESDEAKEEYVFPWYKNKGDIERKRSRHRSKSISEYEFPWERRERLAQEEKKKEKKRKRLAKSLKDDEDEDVSTKKYRRNTYPRGKYRFWNRMKDNSSEEDSSDASDNVESSSVTKPVMKYSSRYNSKNGTLPLDEKSTNVRFSTVEEISKSIKKALEGDSKEILKGKKFSGSLKHKSFKGIVPENVTLASMKKNGKKEITELLAPNSTDVITGKNLLKTVEEKGFGNSSSLTNNSLDNSISRLTLAKANGAINSTKQLNKKRRKPLKNVVSMAESATKSAAEINRYRRKQKLDATTVNTITSSSSTTPASMVVRRKQSKSVKDLKKTPDPEIDDKIRDRDKNQTETSVLKDTALKHHFREPVESNERRSSETIEKSNESKNSKDEKFVENGSMNKDNLSKHSDNQRKRLNNDSDKSKSKAKERLDHNVKQTEETEFEGKSPFSEDKNESFDSKGDSNFDRSDTTPDKDSVSEFGGVLKSDIRLKDSLLRTDTATSAKSLRIETNKGSGNISRQKEYNGGNSVKIELLQGQAEEGKGNGSNIEKREEKVTRSL